MKINERYFMIVDGVPCFGRFVGYCGTHNSLLEFEVKCNAFKTDRVLLTIKEAKENVYGYS